MNETLIFFKTLNLLFNLFTPIAQLGWAVEE